MTVSVASGLYLDWPGLKAFWAIFKPDYRAGMIRLLLDLHRIVGWLGAAALLILAATGFLLSFQSLTAPFAGPAGMHHGLADRDVVSTAVPNNRPPSLAAAASTAQGAFAKAEIRRVTTPFGSSGAYHIKRIGALDMATGLAAGSAGAEGG